MVAIERITQLFQFVTDHFGIKGLGEWFQSVGHTLHDKERGTAVWGNILRRDLVDFEVRAPIYTTISIMAQTDPSTTTRP